MIGRSPFPSRASRIERQAYRWVMKMLDDPTRHAEALESWLAKDPEHRIVYKRVAAEVGYASDAAVRLPTLRTAAVVPVARRSGWRRGGFIMSAGVAAAAGLAGLIVWKTDASRDADAPPPKMESIVLAAGPASRTFNLADGSTVLMTAGSQADVRFSPGERAIDLRQGRARFDVHHDAARPFTVYVRGGKVTAVGTVFEVDAGEIVQVRLLRGRVIVTPAAGTATQQPRQIMLAPGQQTRFDAAPTAEKPARRPDRAHPPARTTRLFDDTPLTEVADAINRHATTATLGIDPAIASEKIFAEMDIGDVESVARKLATMLDLEIDRSHPGKLLLRRPR